MAFMPIYVHMGLGHCAVSSLGLAVGSQEDEVFVNGVQVAHKHNVAFAFLAVFLAISC